MQTFNKILILVFTLTILISCGKSTDKINHDESEVIKKAVSVLPHKRQYEWQKNEFTAFIHFGVNTFTGREWGTGFEDPKIFNPSNLDTDQWCENIKAAGMKMVILTVKHHDGFCLWQTRYTDHSVASSLWKNGNGDVLRELSNSCKKYNLKLGIYLSPADLYQIENKNGLYGNGSLYSLRTIPKQIKNRPFDDTRTFSYNADDYNEYFMNQLFELLTEYGPIHEVWFDGAHPKRKGNQQYTYSSWYDLIRKLAPEAVIFGKGPDVRWCGNEAGDTRNSEWSVVPINSPAEKNDWQDMTQEDLGSIEKLTNSLNNGGYLHWYPAETNTSIRHGWFWRDEKQYVKSVEEILDIWYRSVGGNSVFLLNIPPNNKGLLANRDVTVLRKIGAIIDETFSTNLASGAVINEVSTSQKGFSAQNVLDENLSTCWMPDDSDKNPLLEILLPEKRYINRIVLQEQIQDYSQRISKFNVTALVSGKWIKLYNGTTVGFKKICRFSTIKTDRIKLNILESRMNPTINNLSLHFEKITISNPIIKRDKNGLVNIVCSLPGPIIKYTVDGSVPDINSPTFLSPFEMLKSGDVKAVAYNSNLSDYSEVIARRFDIAKKNWKILNVSSEEKSMNELANNAIDDNNQTNWLTEWKNSAPSHPHFVEIYFGEKLNLIGFTYTPRNDNINGTPKKFRFYSSLDGRKWNLEIEDEFDNIRNNPVKQEIMLPDKIEAKYIKFEALDEVNGNPWTSAAEIGVITSFN